MNDQNLKNFDVNTFKLDQYQNLIQGLHSTGNQAVWNLYANAIAGAITKTGTPQEAVNYALQVMGLSLQYFQGVIGGNVGTGTDKVRAAS